MSSAVPAVADDVAAESNDRKPSTPAKQTSWIKGIRRIASSLQARFATDDADATPSGVQSFPSYGAVQYRLANYLSDHEQRLLMDRSRGWRMHQAGTQLSEQDAPTGDPLLVTKGWGCRVHRVHGRGLLVGLILQLARSWRSANVQTCIPVSRKPCTRYAPRKHDTFSATQRA
ncbi:MAG: hypothetical protein EON93_09080 [Burkholderiales bacterium]|nr:MAG: hypothetical protein EON93_09080 [Burkholderiales bacterium]